MASITHWENSTRSQFTRALQLSVEERGGKRRCSASPSLLLWCAWPPSSEAWPDQTASPGGCKNISLWVATGPTRGAGDLGGGGWGRHQVSPSGGWQGSREHRGPAPAFAHWTTTIPSRGRTELYVPGHVHTTCTVSGNMPEKLHFSSCQS